MPDPDSAPRRRIPYASIAAVAVVVAVFAAAVTAIAWRARAALREQVLRREGQTIYDVALLKVGEPAAKLSDFGAADPTADLFDTVLESSQLRGVIAVRLFDAQGAQRAALPPTDPIKLDGAALAQMARHEPLVRFETAADPAIAFGLPPSEGDVTAPLLEITVPLHAQDKPALLGAARYWIDGSGVAEEFGQIDRQLRLQGAVAIAGGAVILIAVLTWAYRQLARRREDLVRANRELAMMAKTSALGAISAHLIHDLKNPLAGLEGFVRDEAAAASDDTDSGWDEAVQTARRMRSMIADVTALLRDEAEGAFTPLTPQELGAAAIRRVAGTAQHHGVTLRCESGETIEVPGRQANLAVLVLANLLDNACKASPVGAEVLLTAQFRNQELEFLVTDHGTGLPEAMRRELFQPKSVARPGGSGLGLAISQQLARHVGGIIELVRTGPDGTEFRLRIPPVKVAAYALIALVAHGVGGSLRADDLKLVWPRPFFTGQQGEIESSPAMAPDGTIYVGTENYQVFAVNPDGSQKWVFHGAGDAIQSTPAIGADGTVYVGCMDHYLYALAPGNGRELWYFQTGDAIYSSPAIGSDGTIYVGSEDGSLYAVNPDSSQRWKYPTGGPIDSSPAIGADGTIYFGSWDKSLYAINPDGTLKWTFPTGDRIVAPPAIAADGTIYVGSKDGHLYALTPGGNSKWTVSTGGAVETSPAIGPTGSIYFASLDGFLYAAAADGTPRWHIQLAAAAPADYLVSSPAVRADGTIVIGAGVNSVAVVTPDGFIKSRYTTGDAVDSSPVIAANGTIYVGSWDANLYALSDNGPGPAASAWPLFHHDVARAGRAAIATGSAANPGRLVNLSVLDPLSAANPTLTVGFVSGGTGVSGTQSVLVRGIGPSLAAFLSAPRVADPALTVFLNTTPVDANDNWASTPLNQSQVAAADTLVYAFPLTDPSSLDSALVMSVVPNPGYSVQVTGGNPGYALAEVYDATPAGAYTQATPRLINLSCLANLPGNGTLTAGFIITGSTPETVMIRATGPGLASFNLGAGNLMPDPQLTLHTNLNGQDSILGLDKGWNAIPQVVSSIVFDSKSVGAFALPANSQDSVLLETLAPGAYTAQVQSYSGVGGTTLIEVYEIP